MKRSYFIFLTTILALPLMANAAAPSLTERIFQAQKYLAATESRVANERQTLANQLYGLEREVLALREKTAVARRLADEKTLSISKLEERLDSWRQQNVYQQNLLHRFLQQHSPQLTLQKQSNGQAGSADPSDRVAAMLEVIEKLKDRFQPNWQSADVVLSSGEVTAMPVLAIGPVTWYWDSIEKRAGLASVHDSTQNLLHADLLLSSSDSSAIGSLREQRQG